MAIGALLSLTQFAAAQTVTKGAPDRAQVIKVAREVMETARYCVLVTVGEKGQPQARVMDPFPPEADMTVWLATNALSRKVGEIAKDSRVTLVYFDTSKMAYVTLVGTAGLVSDAAEKAKRWKEQWAALYKDRNRGDDYLLIRVRPARLEISATGQGMINDPKTWKPVTLDLR
jgi:general stress protein 26